MIGSLRYRITLINPKRVSNGRGGWTIDLEAGDRMEVWAAAAVTTIAQRIKYREIDEQTEIQFIIRENPFLNKDTRILFVGTVYRIVTYAPHPDSSHFTVIPAREE